MQLSTRKVGVIYTCITGMYDELLDHTYTNNPEWDYICFTDNFSIRSEHNLNWELRKLHYNNLDNVRNQRWHKLHPHLLFPDYDVSIWIDGNINIVNSIVFRDFEHAIDINSLISIGPHPERICLYDELYACIEAGKDVESIMTKQVNFIRKTGFPRNSGLFENNIIFRKHHNDQIIKTMTDWWAIVEKYSRRDQLSLTYVAWKNNISISKLTDISYRHNPGIEMRYSNTHITKEERRARRKRRIKSKKNQP